jgi:hypothetical protein
MSNLVSPYVFTPRGVIPRIKMFQLGGQKTTVVPYCVVAPNSILETKWYADQGGCVKILLNDDSLFSYCLILFYRTALEKCKLSTDSLPKSSPKPSFSPSQSHWSDFYGSSPPNFNEHDYVPSSSFYGQEFMDGFGGVEFNMWMNMDDIGRKSRKKKSSCIRANDLFANLSKLREVAIKKAEVH